MDHDVTAMFIDSDTGGWSGVGVYEREGERVRE